MILSEGLYGSSVALQEEGAQNLRSTAGQVLSATAEESFVHSPVIAIGRTIQILERDAAALFSGESRVVPAEEANEQTKDLGLSFDNWVSEDALNIIVRRRREELARQDVQARSPGGFGLGTTKLLTGFAVQALDPLNVASAFVPVVGPSRFAAMAAEVGVTKARLLTGAVEGAVGTAALEPLLLLAAEVDHADYSGLDSLLNVTFGTILGGGLHVGAGKISDILSRAKPETREAALRASVAQTATGRPVDIEAVLHTDPAFHPSGKALEDIRVAAEALEEVKVRLSKAKELEEQWVEASLKLEKDIQEGPLVQALARGESPELIARQLDSTTGERLAKVEAELASAPSAKRRVELETERDTIRESIAADIPLARARAKAEAKGIKAEQKRLAKEVKDLEHQINIDTATLKKAVLGDPRLKEIAEGLETDKLGIDELIPRMARRLEQEVDLSARRAIDAAQQRSLAGEEPDPLLVPPAEPTPAREAPEDLDAELEAMEADLIGYVAQGAIPESALRGIEEANQGISVAVRVGDTARAAARCLLLHL